jgi:hypothetical protein
MLPAKGDPADKPAQHRAPAVNRNSSQPIRPAALTRAHPGNLPGLRNRLQGVEHHPRLHNVGDGSWGAGGGTRTRSHGAPAAVVAAVDAV